MISKCLIEQDYESLEKPCFLAHGENSSVIAQQMNGYIVRKEGKTILTEKEKGKLSSTKILKGNYWDLAYCNGNYFFYEYSKSKIFQLSENKSSSGLKEFLDVEGSTWAARTLRVSKNCLFVNNQSKAIKIIQIKKNGGIKKQTTIYDSIEGEVSKPSFDMQEDEIIDFYPFKNKDSLIILKTNGYLKIKKKFQFSKKNDENEKFDSVTKIHLNRMMGEKTWAMALCPESKLVVVHVRDSGYQASRLIIIEIENYELIVKHEVSYRNSGLAEIRTMSFYGSQKKSDLVFICGLSGDKPVKILNFCYDPKTGILEEMLNFRIYSEAECCYKLVREEGERKIVGVDNAGKMIEILYLF